MSPQRSAVRGRAYPLVERKPMEVSRWLGLALTILIKWSFSRSYSSGGSVDPSNRRRFKPVRARLVKGFGRRVAMALLACLRNYLSRKPGEPPIVAELILKNPVQPT
jgi:hypothetical protein